MNIFKQSEQTPKTIILVDYENVAQKFITYCQKLSCDDFCLVFYTNEGSTLSFDKINELLMLECQITFIQVEEGKQAADFQISSYLGYLIHEYPECKHIVLSNDKGFEPVILHWKQLNYKVEQAFLSIKKQSNLQLVANRMPKKQIARIKRVVGNIIGVNVRKSDRDQVNYLMNRCKTTSEFQKELIDQFGDSRADIYYRLLSQHFDHYKQIYNVNGKE